jgi:hypothetical protein
VHGAAVLRQSPRSRSSVAVPLLPRYWPCAASHLPQVSADGAPQAKPGYLYWSGTRSETTGQRRLGPGECVQDRRAATFQQPFSRPPPPPTAARTPRTCAPSQWVQLFTPMSSIPRFDQWAHLSGALGREVLLVQQVRQGLREIQRSHDVPSVALRREAILMRHMRQGLRAVEPWLTNHFRLQC